MPSALLYKTFFSCELRSRVTHGKTCKSYNSCRTINTPKPIVHAQVLVTIERNGYVAQVFQKQSLSTSNAVELPDAVRREVNSAVQNVLEEGRNGASGRK